MQIHVVEINPEHKKNTSSESNIAPEMDGWKTTILLGWPIFRGELLVSGRVSLYATFSLQAKLPRWSTVPCLLHWKE